MSIREMAAASVDLIGPGRVGRLFQSAIAHFWEKVVRTITL
jgi:hypothetical protein